MKRHDTQVCLFMSKIGISFSFLPVVINCTIGSWPLLLVRRVGLTVTLNPKHYTSIRLGTIMRPLKFSQHESKIWPTKINMIVNIEGGISSISVSNGSPSPHTHTLSLSSQEMSRELRILKCDSHNCKSLSYSFFSRWRFVLTIFQAKWKSRLPWLSGIGFEF